MYLLKSEMTFDSFKDAFYDGNHYVVWGSSTDLYRYSSNSKKNTIVYSVPEDEFDSSDDDSDEDSDDDSEDAEDSDE